MAQTTLPQQQQQNRQVKLLRDNRDIIESDKLIKALAVATPKHIEPIRLVKAAISAINKNPILLECTRDSFLLALLSCAECGLLPNTALDEAYIIPYKNNKKRGIHEAQFQASYKGLIKLLYNTGDVATVDSQVVYQDEEFEYRRGTDPLIKHIPDFSVDRSKAKIRGSYAIIWPRMDWMKPVIEYCDKTELERIRQCSKAPDSPAWTQWPDQMYRKSVIRRASKFFPRSNERHEDFAKALALDSGEADPRHLLDASDIDALGIEFDGDEQSPGEDVKDALAAKADQINAAAQTDQEAGNMQPPAPTTPENLPPESGQDGQRVSSSARRRAEF